MTEWYQPTLWEIVDEEAIHYWLGERPPGSDERPNPNEYRDHPTKEGPK